MFEKFTMADHGNFRQRYQGTYGFYRNEQAPPMLCRLEFIENVVMFKDKKGIEYTLNPDRPGDIGFEFLPPKSGWSNSREGAIYVERVASRQFQRGVSERNTRIYRLATDGAFEAIGVSFNTLEKVYQETISKQEALTRFLDGTAGSVSISDQIAFSQRHVFVFGKAVGKLQNLKVMVQIKLDDPTLFRTEISDALRGFLTVEFQ